MSTPKLIFFPAQTNLTTDTQIILQSLIDAEFMLADAHNDNHYLPGERFLSLITFLGCSPNINLSPVDGENHCYISLIESSEHATCVGYTNTVNPKCPACTKRITPWETQTGEEKKTEDGNTPNWQSPGRICICDKCQQQTPYAELNWKQECGFARCGFSVSHIYPHEAVPTDNFLELLKLATGFNWNFCYTNN